MPSDEGPPPQAARSQRAAPRARRRREQSLAAERDRLARTLRDTRLQLAMTQARLSALEDSATMTLGRTLVRAARRPWSRGVQLPLDLIRLWRDRGGLTGPGAATLALASAQLNDLAGGGERFLSALTAPGLGAPGAASADLQPAGAGRHRRAQRGIVRDAGPRRGGLPAAAARRGRDAGERGRRRGPDRGRGHAGQLSLGLRRRPGGDRPRPAAGPADRGGPRARQAGDLHPQRPRASGAGPGLGRGQLRRGVRRRLRRPAGPVQPDRAGRPAAVRPGLRRPPGPPGAARRPGPARLADRGGRAGDGRRRDWRGAGGPRCTGSTPCSSPCPPARRASSGRAARA